MFTVYRSSHYDYLEYSKYFHLQFRILQKLLDRFPLCGWLLDFILRLVTTKSTYIRFYIIYEKRRKILFAFRLSN